MLAFTPGLSSEISLIDERNYGMVAAARILMIRKQNKQLSSVMR